MSTHLSRFFQKRRIDKGLSLGQLSDILGYTNRSKGARRIDRFEKEGEIRGNFLVKLAALLDVSRDEIKEHIERDKADWERWAAEPIEPYVIVRWIPAVYGRKAVPDEARHSQETMEAFAVDLAKSYHRSCCLVISRTVRIWFSDKGTKYSTTIDTFERCHAPYMSIKGGSQKFLLRFE